MIAFGFGFYELRKAIGEATFDLIFKSIVPPAIGGLAGLTWFMIAGAWGVMLMHYKRCIFEGRRGKYSFDPAGVNPFNASKYIGATASAVLV